MAEWAAYLGIGAAVGFLAGLLGIGGGVIIVSSLAIMFSHQAFPPEYATTKWARSKRSVHRCQVSIFSKASEPVRNTMGWSGPRSLRNSASVSYVSELGKPVFEKLSSPPMPSLKRLPVVE